MNDLREFVDRGGRTFILRAARADDRRQFIDHFRRVAAEERYLATTSEEFCPTSEAEATWYTPLAAGDPAYTVVAEIEEQIVGHLCLLPGNRVRRDHCRWLGMAIDVPYRGQGLGTALIAGALEWARVRGVEKICLEAFAHNETALALYRRFGFQEEGRQRRHYKVGPGEYWDGILMSLWLGE